MLFPSILEVFVGSVLIGHLGGYPSYWENLIDIFSHYLRLLYCSQHIGPSDQ